MKKTLFAITLCIAAAAAAATPQLPKPVSVYNMPKLWMQHCQLRQEAFAAITSGNYKEMEKICRRALRILPADATWNYNLACALSRLNKPGLALTQLEKAVTLGFRNTEAIAKDDDLARIATYPRFREILAKARNLGDELPPNAIPISPIFANPGEQVTLTETNLVWNFETGLMEAQLKLAPPSTPTADLADAFLASAPTAPERNVVQSWLKDGSAAGNSKDIYINRDGGHSQLKTADFPLLTSILYDAPGRAAGANLDHPNTCFDAGYAVFGNVSRANIHSQLWRSMPRTSLTEPGFAARMNMLYLNNQFWVFVSHNDFGKPGIGDVFPGNAPFQFVAAGASWSDQPFLRAALAASAAMRPLTKTAILRRHLMGPTLQWLLRSTRPGVNSEADYLSPGAHPAAFEKKDLDTLRLVEKAHSLQPKDIPPAVRMVPVNSRISPIPQSTPGKDYVDEIPELLYATPCAIGYVLRDPRAERQFIFRSLTYPEIDNSATFAWKVVNGNPAAVTITAPPGEAAESPDIGCAMITIDRRKMDSRIDVACFAKSQGTDFGAPSIISFYPLPIEKRTYRPDGKTAAIDYSNPDNLYCDPVLALPRRWTDTFIYSDAGDLQGFTRSYNGEEAASFITANVRVTERNAQGRPVKGVKVKYIPRQTGSSVNPVELTYTDEGSPFSL